MSCSQANFFSKSFWLTLIKQHIYLINSEYKSSEMRTLSHCWKGWQWGQSDIDNYEIDIFLSSLLIVPTSFFWPPWFRVRIKHCSQNQPWFWIWPQSIFSFDGAAFVAAQGKSLKSTEGESLCKGVQGLFPLENFKIKSFWNHQKRVYFYQFWDLYPYMRNFFNLIG